MALVTLPVVTLHIARSLVADAVGYADEHDLAMSVAVVDAGGNLMCFERMDGANLVSAEIAQAKAYTALAFKSETGALSQHAQPGGACYAMESSVSRPLVFWGGGLPLMVGDHLVGGLGAGGGSPDEDAATAQAAIAGLTRVIA